MRSPRSASVAAAFVVLLALTGCAGPGTRHVAAISGVSPTPVATSTPTLVPASASASASADELDTITRELQGVDGSLAQADTDTADGDSAAALGNKP